MRTRPDQKQLLIDGPAGVLQAMLESPGDCEPSGSVVVCHPHPSFGGTMLNKVAHTLARSFVSAGFAALRFNFRGVGQSGGCFDNGKGEVDDVLAAAAWLREELPQRPLWLAGFSFGAAMAFIAAVTHKPDGLVTVAPAISRFVDAPDRQPDCPWLIVQGDQDELVDVDEIIDWVNTLRPGPQLQVIAGTEHFFHGKLLLLHNSVNEFIRDRQLGDASDMLSQ